MLLGKMEDFVETLDDSDCSNLSTTQEIDIHAYEGLRKLLEPESLSVCSVSSHHQSDKQVSDVAPDPLKSYTDNDTGHIKLDFSPQSPPSLPSSDGIRKKQLSKKPGTSKMSNKPQENASTPQTPAHSKFVTEQPGTVMRASQLFQETQPSPGSRSRQGVGPSSDRPTPGLYNNLRLQNYELSPQISPLIQHAEKGQPTRLATIDHASSPLQLSKGDVVDKTVQQLSRNLHRMQPRASLYDKYESRKESQERRMRLASVDGSQSSDDAFSDNDIKISRRAKRAKEAAAREIAFSRVSIPHSTLKSDEVEVPSTNTRRRRNQSEAHSLQGNENSGDSQEINIIADSQVIPTTTVEDVPSLTIRSDESGLAEGTAYSANPNDTKVPDTSARLSARRLYSENCNNKNYSSPVEYKVCSTQDVTGLVPETSPIGPLQCGPAVYESDDVPAGAVGEVTEIENHSAKDLFLDKVDNSPTMRPQSRRQIRASAEQVQKPSKGKSSSDEIPHLMQSTSTIEPATTKAQKMVLTSPGPNGNSEEKQTLESVPSPASSSTSDTKAQAHKQMSSSNKLLPRPLSLIRENDDRTNKTAEDIVSFHPEARADVVDSPNDPVATERLEVPLEGQTPSTDVNDGINTASAAGGSNNIILSEESMTSAPERSKKNIKRSKGTKNASDISRRPTMKTKALSKSTPKNAFLTSTYKPVTRSSRQASVMSERSKTTETEEDRDIPIISVQKRLLHSRSASGNLGIFRNMVFSVSYTNRIDEKKRVVQLIKQHGGQLLENGFDELFNFSSETSSSAGNLQSDDLRPINLILNAKSRNIGFVCLIADEHSRKAKYMQALALGLPCISGRWIEHCVIKSQILDWDSYLLAAGESSFLGGAVHNRNLQPYSALTVKFAEHFEERKKLLEKKSILLIMGNGRAEERKKAYLFLTQVLGTRRVKRVRNNQEARKVLLESESEGELWDLVYVDEEEEAAEKAIFGAGPSRKRKRGSDMDASDYPIPKKVRIISDEFVIQSLILGKLLDESE